MVDLPTGSLYMHSFIMALFFHEREFFIASKQHKMILEVCIPTDSVKYDGWNDSGDTFSVLFWDDTAGKYLTPTKIRLRDLNLISFDKTKLKSTDWHLFDEFSFAKTYSGASEISQIPSWLSNLKKSGTLS
jgi:hypothetical protein